MSYNNLMIAEIKRFWGEKQNKKNLAIVLWAYLILNWLLYMPFVFQWGRYGVVDFQQTDTSVFMRYWDGPFYAGVAKTFYSPDSDFYDKFTFSSPEYLSNHYPLFPLLVGVFDTYIPMGMALLLVNQVFAVVGIVLLYYFFTLFFTPNESRILSLVQLLIPIRTMVFRNVGNSEMVFFVFIVLVFIFLVKNKFWGSVVAAALATLTRPVGVFLSIGLLLIELTRRNKKILYLMGSIVPLLAFVMVSLFQTSIIGDLNLSNRPGGFHLFIQEPPLALFFLIDYAADGIFVLYLATVAGLLVLYQKGKHEEVYRRIFWVCASSLAYLIFSTHSDNSRFIWPFLPFAVLLPLKDLFTDKRFYVALLIMIPAILLSNWGVLIVNEMPDWMFGEWLRAVGN